VRIYEIKVGKITSERFTSRLHVQCRPAPREAMHLRVVDARPGRAHHFA
jgi:hypothetical protein